MQPTWLIHNYSQTEFDKIKSALESTNTPFQEIQYQERSDLIDKLSVPKIDECVICYGSLQFSKAFRDLGLVYTPGFYGLSDRVECSQYMPNISAEYLLNYPYIIASWAELKRSKVYYSGLFSSDSIFVKPNSGKKTFPGQLLSNNIGCCDKEIKTIEQTSGVSDQTLVLISKGAVIDKNEYRFVIANKKVITGSMYNWDDESSHSYPKEAEELAQKIADLDWQLDTCYTCDIAMTKEEPKVIELNSFSCAGLYDCDREKIVNAVNQAALNDYNEIFENKF